MTANKFYGEHDTDRYLRNTFYPDYDYKGIMIELGAGDPEVFSLSKHFRDNGWRCICIEPNPVLYERHKALGNEIYNYACSNERGKKTFYIYEDTKDPMSSMSHSSLGMKYGGSVSKEIEVEVIKLDDLLEKLGIKSVDLVCVDVEGWELEVLGGLNLDKYRPKVVVLENYRKLPDYSQYMSGRNYTHNTSADFNEIYVRSDDAIRENDSTEPVEE